ncbi:hypothetical protein PG991_005754 [Apiospora marii]|uniref:OTU domain-containing protein n=1 Tax=Apiospora marii TaxID=335849 RepID=A0ABR1SA89_9PEZI
MASESVESSSPVGTKRKFADTQLPSRSPHHKRRICFETHSEHSEVDEDDTVSDIDATATGFSSPLSEVSEGRLPTVEEFHRLEQERLTVEQYESQVQEVIEVKTGQEDDPDELHKDLKATLAQIKTANKGLLTPEAFEYLQSEVASSHLYLPEPKAEDIKPKGVDAATNTQRVIKVVRSSKIQTEVIPGPIASTQTFLPASNEVAIQTEPMNSNAGVQTDPIPKTFPSSDEVYKKDLEYIRRVRPFVSSADVITVKCRLRKEPTKTPSKSRFGTASYLPSPSKTHNGVRSSVPRPSKSQVVSLVDDDNDDDVSMVEMPHEGNWRTGGSRYGNDFVYGNLGGLGDAGGSDNYEEALEKVEFYGIQEATTSATRTRTLLRYQDRQTGIGEYPSPIFGLRLHQDKYRTDIRSKHWRDPIPLATDTLQKTSWGSPAPVDDKAAMSNWTSSGSYQLLKGFPLVEDVEFIVHRNMPAQEPDGDCYWRSAAFCLYGSDEHWDVVKAEHLGYLHYVLSQPQHPRYELYHGHLNARFFDTSSVDGATFKANIWQLLHLAHAWTPAVISQVTADLYNICVVIFTLENGVTTETNVRGVYNSRHVFLCFTNGCHFQPMTPNDYDAWEFKYPRITVEATAKYVNAPKATSAKQTWQHPWRKEFSSAVLPPVPRLHGCNIEKLRRFLGSNPKS